MPARRPAPLALALALALVVVAAQSPSSAAAAAAAAHSSAGKKNGHRASKCPAQACELATHDHLEGLAASLMGYYEHHGSFVTSRYDGAAACAIAATDTDPDLVWCTTAPHDSVPNFTTYALCADNYGVMARSSCAGVYVAADGSASFLPILTEGHYDVEATCRVDVSSVLPLPAGASIFAQITYACTKDQDALGGLGGATGALQKKMVALAAKEKARSEAAAAERKSKVGAVSQALADKLFGRT